MNIEQLIEQSLQWLFTVLLEVVDVIKSSITAGIALAIIIIWRLPAVIRTVDKISLRLYYFSRKNLSYKVNTIYKSKDSIKALLSECYGYALGKGYSISHISLYYTHNGDNKIYGGKAEKMSMLQEHGYDKTFLAVNQNILLKDLEEYLTITNHNDISNILLKDAKEALQVQFIKHGWKQLSVVTYNDRLKKPLLVLVCYFDSIRDISDMSVNKEETTLSTFLKNKLILINALLKDNELYLPTFKQI